MSEQVTPPRDDSSGFWRRMRQIVPRIAVVAVGLIVGGVLLPWRRPGLPRRTWPTRVARPRMPSRFHGPLRG